MAFRDNAKYTITMQRGNMMNRFEYLETLKQAMEGMPPEVIAATVTEYERRITEASAAGKSEEEILAGLENPQAVAAQRRAAAQIQAFKQNKTPVNFFRLCFSLLGLLVFNAFLIVPALVYSLLLVCGYIVTLACYGGGIVATSVAIAGVNEISLNNSHPDSSIQHVQIYMKDKDGNAKVDVGNSDKASEKARDKTSATSAPAMPAASDTTSASMHVSTSTDAKPASTQPAIRVSSNGVRIDDGKNNIKISGDDGEDMSFGEEEHGVTVELPGMHIYSPRYSNNVFLMSDGLGASPMVQVMIGLGLTLIGIIGFLLCLTISRYSVLGIFRLAEMEFAVLKNA